MAVLTQVIIMMILILVGILCFKLKIITKQVSKGITSLVLKVVNPIIILVSYQKPFNINELAGLGWAFVFAAICTAVVLLVPMILVRGGKNKAALAVERFSATYTNCMFMGVPLIQGVFGMDAVFYLTAYMTFFNILVWTHGVISMRGEGGGGRQMLLSVVKTPALIATVIGIVLFLLNITLPSIPMTILNDLAALNTPLAMFAAGAVIAETDLLNALKNVRIYWICIVRLVILPLICLVIMLAVLRAVPGLSAQIAGVCLLAAACPTAATGTLFAIEYGKDSSYASQLFTMTTIFSIITMPLMMNLWNLVA